MAIFTPLPKYFENISKLAGLKTFIVVCEFLVKTAVKKKKKPRLQETLALFQEYHNLDYESV